MRIKQFQAITFIVAVTIMGCASNRLPKTLGEQYSNFAYIPVDPLPVSEKFGNSCYEWSEDPHKVNKRDTSKVLKPLRIAFPDQTARLAISQIDVNGNISYGPVTAGTKNSSYKVTFDYAASDVSRVSLEVIRVVSMPDKKQNKKLAEIMFDTIYNYNGKNILYSIDDTIGIYDKIFRGESKFLIYRTSYNDSICNWVRKSEKSDIVVFPVYVGFGVRLTATIKVSKNKVDISGLGAISAGVEAGEVSGTLVMQSLGITGEAVRNNFPVQSEINQATIQNALISIGSIKSLVDDPTRTYIEPRVLGFYNPIGGGAEIVNKVISQLAQKPVAWYRPCEE